MAIFMVMIVGGCKKKLPTEPQDNDNNEYTYPLNISNDELNSYSPEIAVDVMGRVYVLWFDAEGLRLRIRDENGKWGNIKTLTEHTFGYDIGSDQLGNVHIIYEKTHTDSSGAAHDSVFYVEIDGEGNMSDEIALNDEADVDQPVIAVDSLGGVHVMWRTERHGWLYRYRSPEGDWVWRDTLVASYDNPFLYAKPDGSLVMIFSPGYRIIYRERPYGGRWGQDEFVDTSDIAVFSWWGSYIYDAGEGKGYVFWTEGNHYIDWRARYSNGIWGRVIQVDTTSGSPADKVIIRYNNNLFMVWNDFNKGIMFGAMTDDMHTFRSIVHLTDDGYTAYVKAAVDKNGILHIVWSEKRNNNNFEIYYTYINLN